MLIQEEVMYLEKSLKIKMKLKKVNNFKLITKKN